MAWDRSGLMAYAVLSMALAAAFGFSAGTLVAHGDLVEAIDSHRKERMEDAERHHRDVSYLRNRLVEASRIQEALSEQLSQTSVASANAAKQANEAVLKALEQRQATAKP
jgi:hypothetical protein